MTATDVETFKWELNGKELKDGQNGVKIIREEKKSRLIIEKSTKEHTGRVTVTAINESGSDSCSSNITVESKKVAPKIVEGPKNVSIKEKESAEFNAVVTGEPTPTVRWEINEKIVESYEENVTITQSGEKHTLKITNVKKEQSGEVQIVAENVAGKDQAKAKMEVKPGETKPAFKTTLKDAKVEEGQSMRFDAELENPSPGTKVTWLLNGKELAESDKVKVSGSGGMRSHFSIVLRLSKIQITKALPTIYRGLVWQSIWGLYRRSLETTLRAPKCKP